MRQAQRSAAIGMLVGLATAGAVLPGPARADDPVSVAIRYNREIVRIFERKCIACHTDAALAMPLDSYHDVRPWARAIREEILERRMPPWPAAPGVRPLANELALTTREIAIITAWIDGGTPRGEPSDLPPPKLAATWRAGEPELTLTLPPQQVKPDGNAYVRRVTLATGLTHERWLRGFDVAAGERRALRSVLLYVKTGNGQQWLGGWTPWYAMTQPPESVGFRLPAGASIDAELHYAAWDESDRPLTDSSLIGLYFHPKQPPSTAEALIVTAAASGTGAEARGEATLRADTVVWALRPRMVRGGDAQPGSIEVRAITPGGTTEPLLWILDHRPEWQLPYVLREPLRLPRGTRIVLTAQGDDIGSATVDASLVTYRPASVAAPTTEPLKGRSPQPQRGR
jgi:hypothetical protein